METTSTWSPAGRRVATIGLAVAGGSLLRLIADPLAGVDLVVGSGADARPIGPAGVAGTAAVAGLAASALAVLLARTTRRPRRSWLIVAVTVLAISLAGPLGAATAAAGLVLAALHLVVGVILILGIGGTMAKDTQTGHTPAAAGRAGRVEQ